MRKRTVIAGGAAASLAVGLFLIPAGGGAVPVGPNQAFSGRVNGGTTASIVVANCPNGSDGTTPFLGLTYSVVQSGGGNTGTGASQISITASGIPTQTITDYSQTASVAASSIEVSCGPSGNNRDPVPTTVTFASNGSGATASTVTINWVEGSSP